MAVTADLAGRRDQLDTVKAVLTGRADVAALLVVGEAGVGKSRLVAAATELAGQDDVCVLTGACLRLTCELPFQPVAQVVRELLELDRGQLIKSLLADCPAFVRAEIARLIPELWEDGDHRELTERDEGWGRRRLFDALTRLLDTLALDRAVAVVVEDVHWADTTTLDFLDYLRGTRRAQAIPLVMTCRGDETSESLTDRLESLQRDPKIRRMDLPALTSAETADQIALQLGVRPNQRFIEDIYARSEGNAFFTEQLVASAEIDNVGNANVGPLPAGLTELLSARTAEATGVGRQILGVLGVASRPLPEAAVIALCGRPLVEVREGLRDLLDRRLLRRPGGADLLELRHALLAEVVRDELLPRERIELHARVAELMAGWDGQKPASQIAEHFASAGRHAEELRWRVVAAREAEALYATKEAAGHWRRAIVIWDQVPDPEAVAGLDLLRVYLRVVATTENAGDGVTASAFAEEALSRFAGTATGQVAVSLYAEVGVYRGIDAPEAGLQALAEAIAIGECLPPSRDYIRALHNHAALTRGQGRFGDYRAAVTRALAAARESADHREEKLLLGEIAWDAMSRGRVREALAGFETASAIVVDPEDPKAEVMLKILEADVLLKVGDLDRAVEVGMVGMNVAVRSGQANAHITHVLRSVVCEALTEQGDTSRAATLIDPATQDTPSRDSRFVHCSRADLDTRRGRLADAAAFWDNNRELMASLASSRDRVETIALHLETSLWLGDPSEEMHEALRDLEVVRATDESQFAGVLFVLAMRACADIAEQSRARGDTDRLQEAVRAGALLTDLHASAKVDPFAGGPIPATMAADGLSWRAELCRLQGDSDPRAWEAAAAAWDGLQRPHRAAYARWRQAEALLATAHGRASAADILRTAAGEAAQHVPLSRAVQDLARRARITLPETDSSLGEQSNELCLPVLPASDKHGLTDRELAVLQLLAEGKTNAAIGAALFISPKTASVHVTNILRKLQVTSRVQAATVAERAGLLVTEVERRG